MHVSSWLMNKCKLLERKRRTRKVAWHAVAQPDLDNWLVTCGGWRGYTDNAESEIPGSRTREGPDAGIPIHTPAQEGDGRVPVTGFS